MKYLQRLANVLARKYAQDANIKNIETEIRNLLNQKVVSLKVTPNGANTYQVTLTAKIECDPLSDQNQGYQYIDGLLREMLDKKFPKLNVNTVLSTTC